MTKFNKTELYKNRNFNLLWNDSFQFFKSNAKKLINLFVVFVLPMNIIIFLLNKVFIGFLTNNYLEGYEVYNYLESMDTYNYQIANYFTSFLFGFVKISWLMYIMGAFMIVYNEVEDINTVSIPLVFKQLKDTFFKYLFITALLFIVVLLVSGSIYILALKMNYFAVGIIFLLLIIPMIYFSGAYYLIYPTYLLEEDDIILAISKAIKTNNKGWKTIFGYIFILSFIVGLFNIACTLPTIIYNVIIPFFTLNNFSQYGLFINFFNTSISIIGTTFSSILIAIGVYFIYFTFSENSRNNVINQLIDSIDSPTNSTNL